MSHQTLAEQSGVENPTQVVGHLARLINPTGHRAVVTHHGRLEDAPGLYRAFDQRADGVIKAVLRP